MAKADINPINKYNAKVGDVYDHPEWGIIKINKIYSKL